MKKQVKKTTNKSPKKLTKKQLEALKIHDNVLLKQKKDHNAEKLAEKLAIRNKGAEYWHDRCKMLEDVIECEEMINDLFISSSVHDREIIRLEKQRSFIYGMLTTAIINLIINLIILWS